MRLQFLAILAPFAATSAALSFPAPALAPDAVPPAVPIRAQAFDLADVRLGAGLFRDAMERDEAYLLRLDPDRLLHTFRLNVHLPSSAEPYGGWEGPEVELRGHSTGHYLSACSLMYRSTGSEELQRRLDYLVGELARCQAAAPAAGFHEGYLSAFPESFIDRVETGQPVWAPWYTLHKILAGLLDAHRLAGNRQALDVAVKLAAWVQFRVAPLTPAQMQASLKTEFGGMNEALANLYALTGDPAHLHLARAFDQAALFDPLARGEDALDGLHANTQIPKAIGAAREFEVTGEPRDRTIATHFWERVALHRSYVIGGHSDREYFFPVTEFARHLGPETTETCNTYNMLKLTQHLFAWTPEARFMDFYERALYNHILASQDPAQGMFVYLMPLEPGHFKTYSTPEHSFWCCVGTGMENHAKYGEAIFAHDDRTLFVNLFIPAEVTWRERGVVVRQETRFPESATTRLVWTLRAPAALALRIRHPEWARGALTATVNGQPVDLPGTAGSFAEIARTWRTGDVVEVRFPMALHTETLPGVADTIAVLYGPVVLAAKLGGDDLPNPYVRDQLDQARFPHPAVPVFVATDPDWLQRIEMVSRSPLLFRTRGLAQPRDVLLAPFSGVHHERTAVYWQVRSPAAWQQQQQAAAAVLQQWRSLADTAADQVAAGDLKSEGAHRLTGDNTQTGTVSGRGWRQAQHKGFFGYTLTTGGAGQLDLVCLFGSRDTSRNFTVLVDDVKIAAPQLDGSAPGEVFVQKFAVPAAVTRGKPSVVVKFLAGEQWDAATANVFACALVPTPKHE